MQISHVLLLFISLHYLGSAKCHIMLFAYCLGSAVVKLRTPFSAKCTCGNSLDIMKGDSLIVDVLLIKLS